MLVRIDVVDQALSVWETKVKSLTIDGQRIAYEIAGHGPLTVILETGLGADSSDWAGVQQLLDGIATTFRYDRLGRGESSPSNGPRDALMMVCCLRAVLEAADVAPPYLLVGHSFGGLIGQVFADRHRSEISGLVLVESVHPDQFEELGPAFPTPQPDDSASLVSMRRFWTEGWKGTGSTAESIDFPASFKQAPGGGALDGLPLHVLASGSFAHIPFLPVEARRALQMRWAKLQDRLCSLSNNVTHTTWPASGHFLQRENAFAVTAAIVDLAKQI